MATQKKNFRKKIRRRRQSSMAPGVTHCTAFLHFRLCRRGLRIDQTGTGESVQWYEGKPNDLLESERPDGSGPGMPDADLYS